MLRVMSEAANTVPVTILTGFLGSGKTTVLNHLLRQPSLADTVVIVNEFGAVGLDHLLIEQAIEDAVLLKNGCICCTVRGDIADTLEVLWQRRDAGELPPFRRIAIETTGLADPAPVAHALLADPGARYACHLDGIVTTVDALHGAFQLDRQPEARRQVAMADRILLTKTDLASPAQTAETETRVARRIDIGGAIVTYLTWQHLFWIGASIGLVTLTLAALQSFAQDPGVTQGLQDLETVHVLHEHIQDNKSRTFACLNLIERLRSRTDRRYAIPV